MGFTEAELEKYGFGETENKTAEQDERFCLTHEEDLTLIQGIIDVFWIEDDGIVLLDYKTDHVTADIELIGRYQTQLRLYAEALERIFSDRKLKVKEVLIYSFCLEKVIPVGVDMEI